MSRQNQNEERDDTNKHAIAKRIVKRVRPLEERVKSIRWEMGQIIDDEMEKAEAGDKTAIYVLVARELNYSKETIRKYHRFFQLMPDLKQKVANSGVSISKFYLLAQSGFQEIPPWYSEEQVKNWSVRELRDELRDEGYSPLECTVCRTNLKQEKEGKGWDWQAVCNDCGEHIDGLNVTETKLIRKILLTWGTCQRCGAELEDTPVNVVRCSNCEQEINPEEVRDQVLNEILGLEQEEEEKNPEPEKVLSRVNQ